ncbi:MAG: hypothetical protein L0387_39240 [Acidobacteria bacterium]|nr:hypothetical protein [Acidobacteriota bacterium]
MLETLAFGHFHHEHRVVKRIRPVAIFCGVLVLLVLIAVLVERVRGQLAVRSWKKEMLARGEKINVIELIPAPSPPEMNAAPGLIAAAKQLPSVPTNVPPLLKFLTPEQAIVSSALEIWEMEKLNGKGVVTNTWADVDHELESATKLLAQMIETLQKPSFNSGAAYTNGFTSFEVPWLAQVKKAGQWLSARCIADLRKGNRQQAFAALTTLNSLMHAQESEPLMISQLVRVAVVHFAFGTLWQSLQTDCFNDAQLQALGQQWQANHFLDVMVKSFEIERDMTIDHFRILRGSKSKLDEAVRGITQLAELIGTEDSVEADSFFAKYVQVPLWKAAYSYHDELRSLRTWEERIAEARSLQTNSWVAVNKGRGAPGDAFSMFEADEIKGYCWYGKLRFLFSASTTFSARATLLRAIRADTMKELAIAAIALKRFHMVTGKYPEHLSALVPAYLSAVPKDCMDGNPLRYRLKPDGAFLLYSIGEDGKDDGDDGALVENKIQKTTTWDGRDALWPQPTIVKRLTLARPNRK